MFEKVKLALQSILSEFESGDIPEAIAYSTFSILEIPAAKWSRVNRTLMFIVSTQDTRGFRQWMDVGRHLKKGSKAFVILAPRFVKKEGGKEENERRTLAGLLAISVLRVVGVLFIPQKTY